MFKMIYLIYICLNWMVGMPQNPMKPNLYQYSQILLSPNSSKTCLNPYLWFKYVDIFEKLLVFDKNNWNSKTVCKQMNVIIIMITWDFLLLDKNTWNYITVCKSFVLIRVTWSYDCFETIKLIVKDIIQS